MLRSARPRAPVHQLARSPDVLNGLYPVPFDVMADQDVVKSLPEIDILDRFLGGGFPTIPLPVYDPLRDPVLTYVLSVWIATRIGRFSARSPSIAAWSSIRLFVVSCAPPDNSFSTSLNCRIAPQPPGPGLPLQAPSVKISTIAESGISQAHTHRVTRRPDEIAKWSNTQGDP